ncbi:uncharacterized protein TNCV_3617771 [Trichonephila clavipes]|nr:uncharacterized protein TNCV_3617771 [Trichonephila clavipes]
MRRDPTFQNVLEVFFRCSYMESSDLHMVLGKDITRKGHLTKNLFDLIADAFAVLEISIHGAWSLQLSNNRRAMMQSAEKYVCNIMCMCWLEKTVVTDIYDRTLSVIALVKYMSEAIYFISGKRFYKLNSRILTVFFENCLREDFKKRGGWKRLEKHILSRKFREYHDECAAYHFVIDDIPDDLKRKIRLAFASTSGLPKEVPGERINYLTVEVMWSVGTSLLNEINSPKWNKESVSKKVEESSLTITNVLKDLDMTFDEARCIKADVCQDLNMTRSSEKQMNLCASHLSQLEEKLKDLILIFELLEADFYGEGHEANDKDCKRYQEEIEILKIKVQQQISRNEAVENSKGKKTSYSAKTYNDQTEKIENLEKKFAKLEMKFDENNNIFEKKLEQIVQRFTSELNTMVAQTNLRFSSLMNTMESALRKVASNITIQKDADCLINRKQNEKAKRFKKISEQRGNTLDSVVEKNKKEPKYK